MRIVLATDGDPRAAGTFSGSSARLCAGLDGRGALAASVDVKPRWLSRVEQGAAIGRDRVRWQQRYWSGASRAAPAVRRTMSALGRRQVAAIPRVDAVLQISGWYDARPAGSRALLASYQDANGELWRGRPDLLLAPGDAALRRAREAERRTYGRMDLICTMSEWARRSFVRDFGVDPGRVVTVGAGPNLDGLPRVAERAPGPARVLFVGRTFGRKGGPDVLAGFRLLRERLPDATLDVVGPPPGEPEPGVTWHGRIADRDRLGSLYARATAFVLPSRYEAFGISFLEAMAHGLPCVGADVCAIPEIVRHGSTGLLVPPADPAAIADALETLARDPARARALGRAGRAAVEERWTWEATAGRIVAALEARLPAAGARAPVREPLAAAS